MRSRFPRVELTTIVPEVIVPAVIPCWRCDLCKQGRSNVCRAQVMPGNDLDGGFAEFIAVPGRGLCLVADRGGYALAAGRPLINSVGRPKVVINGTCLDFLAESFMAGDPHQGGGFVVLNGVQLDEEGRLVALPEPYPGGNPQYGTPSRGGAAHCGLAPSGTSKSRRTSPGKSGTSSSSLIPCAIRTATSRWAG